MKNSIDEQCFVDCENIKENSATFDFATNILKQGQVKLATQQVKRISLILSTDLLNFAETSGNPNSLTANDVYTHLQNNQ